MRQVGLLVGAFGLAATLALTGCKSTGAAKGACCGACSTTETACCGTCGSKEATCCGSCASDHGHKHDDAAACCGACGGEKKN